MDDDRKRLFKSSTDRMIAGVCGGVAEYFGIDPAIVRVLWALSVFLGGVGILLYVAAIIVMPASPGQAAPARGTNDRTKFWGFLLVGLGILLLVDNLHVFPLWDLLSWEGAVAVLLIAIGAIFIWSHLQKSTAPGAAEPRPETAPQRPRKMHRSRSDRKIMGVCGGIADYLDVDSTLVRLLFVVLVFYSIGFGLVLYILLGIVLQDEELRTTSA